MRRICILIVLASVAFAACHKDSSLTPTPLPPDTGPLTVATFTPSPTQATPAVVYAKGEKK